MGNIALSPSLSSECLRSLYTMVPFSARIGLSVFAIRLRTPVFIRALSIGCNRSCPSAKPMVGDL